MCVPCKKFTGNTKIGSHYGEGELGVFQNLSATQLNALYVSLGPSFAGFSGLP
jgi:hypothetical protein